MPFEESDRALVERAKRGDMPAFSVLHGRYYPKIYRLAYLKTGSAEDAQDIACDTFCRALKALPQYELRRGDSFYPWLHRIASNLIVDVHRTRPPGGTVSLDAAIADELDSFLEQLPDTGPSPEEIAERHEVQALVREAIAKLPKDQGTAVAYRFLGDLSIKEIARELKKTEGAVKSLLHRALVTLRREIAARLAEREGETRLGHGAPPVLGREREGASRPETHTETEVRNVIRISGTDRG